MRLRRAGYPWRLLVHGVNSGPARRDACSTNRKVRTVTIRKAGGNWRLLVHEWAGRAPGEREGTYGVSHDVSNDPIYAAKHPDGAWNRTHLLPSNTEFDEFVVGKFLHIEQMDTGRWWANIGGVTIWIYVDRDGRPKSVSVFGPGDYADPVDGCEYKLAWRLQ